MKLSSWLLCAIALAIVLGVFAMVARQAKMTPSQSFAIIEERARKGSADREQTIAGLDRVLDRATEVGDVELGTRAMLLRGQTLMELGAYDRAREDLSAVAAARPGDVAVENDLAELEARSGDFKAAQVRVARMIQRDPANLSAYVRLGKLHQQSAERTIERTLEILSRSLIPENSERAKEILLSSASLLPADPRRVALSEELRRMLTGGNDRDIEDAINSADMACLDLVAAREAFTSSIERGLDPDAVAALITLFHRAGTPALAVDLGTATVRSSSLRQNTTFARAFLAGLLRIGRLRYAADLAEVWTSPQTPPDSDLYAECCVVLWRAKRYGHLGNAAVQMSLIGSAHQISASDLYLGLASFELGRKQDARQFLYKFCASDTPDPFPKARAIAYQYIARASRDMGEPIPERTALQGLVDLDPELDPEAWLRLAELQIASPHGGYREPEMRWALGMSLLPARTTELMARWNEIGSQELRSIGLDLAAVRSDLQHRKIWTPSAGASPYELFRLAEIHADAGDYGRASNHVRKLLEQLPGFIPALDLAIRIADKQKKSKELMAHLLERVRLAGRTSAIDKILRDLRLGQMSSRDLYALMRADPDRTGRLALAEGLAREGRVDEGIALIQQLGPETLGDEGKRLLASLYLARHEPAAALAVLAPLTPAIYAQPEGLELLVRAGVGSGNLERMLQVGQELAAFVVPAPIETTQTGLEGEFTLARERALWIVDQFLASGQGAAAQPILDALDAIPRLRGGDLNLRLAGAAIAQGDVEAARTAIERAQAFDTRGAAEYLALLLAAFEGRADELRYLAGVTATSNFPATPLQSAQFLILGERSEDAATTLDAGLSRELGDDPWWNLTAYASSKLRAGGTKFRLSPFLGRSAAAAAETLFGGGSDDARDPRIPLVFVSASRVQIAAPFVRAWLDRETSAGKPSNLWLDWMRASLESQWDTTGAALETLRQIRADAPAFGPAWNLEESILARGTRTQAEVASARARRIAALGEFSGTRGQRLLDDAEEKTAAGLYDAALAAAEEAVSLDPTSVEASVSAAAIQRQMGRSVPAITTLRTLVAARAKARGRVASKAVGRNGNDLVTEYLGAIESARKLEGNVITWKRASTLLEELAGHLPDDPRVALAAAKLDLEQDARNPTHGVARAYSRLERFRAQHEKTPIESLGRGSLREWAQFYAKLDPRRARHFIEEQLLMAPASLEPWMALARALEAEGDIDGALKQLRVTARLSPLGSVDREILRLRALGELSYEQIEASVADIISAEGMNGPDSELALVHARAILNQGPRAIERVGQILARVNPAELSPASTIEHTLLIATSLVMRGRPIDKQAAQPLLAGLKERDLDLYVKGFVEVLEGFARAP